MSFSFRARLAQPVNDEPCYAPMPATDSANRLEQRCRQRGLAMGQKRRVIIQVLSEMDDHPDSQQIHMRALAIDPRISIATVYRTLALFEQDGIVKRTDFGDGRLRYELADKSPHHHMIDTGSGEVVEFSDADLDSLVKRLAAELGYDLVDYRLDLYGQRDTP
jgi:Fur family ferric uptake transcriptional regulator